MAHAAGPRRFMKSPLAVIFLTVALDLVGFGMVVPLLPLYATQFGATATQIAFLFASYSLMQFFFAPVWGRISDRVGRRPVLLVSIVGNMLALLIYGTAHSYGWLLTARLLAGICTANISVANAYVADVTTPQHRARGMGLIGAAFGIGFVVGPFVGGELSRFGLSAPAFVAAGLSFINVIWAFFFLPESLKPQAMRAPPAGGIWQQRWRALRSGGLPRTVLGLIFLQVLGFSMMEMALVLFAKARLQVDAPHAGRLFAYVGIVLAVVQGGLIGRLNKRFGEIALVRGGLCAVTLGLALVPCTPPGSWVVLLTALTFLGAGQGLVSPALSSLLSRRTNPNNQGATLGVGQSLSSLARTVGPQVAGVAIDRGNENWPFWLGCVVIGGACALAFPASANVRRLRPVRYRAARLVSMFVRLVCTSA